MVARIGDDCIWAERSCVYLDRGSRILCVFWRGVIWAVWSGNEITWLVDGRLFENDGEPASVPLPLSPLPCVMFVCKRICFIAISLSPIASASNSSFQFSDSRINVGSFEWLTRVSESEMDGIYPSPTRYRLSTRAQWADNADIADIGRWEIRKWEENEGRIRCHVRSGCGSPLSCPCTSSSSHDGTATGHADKRP